MRTVINRFMLAVALAGSGLFLPATGVAAQSTMTEVDPNTAIDADLARPGDPPAQPPADPAPASESVNDDINADPGVAGATINAPTPGSAAAIGTTYKEDDLIGAAEGVFGKGAEGLAKLIQGVLAEQGEPNAYIVGREAGGALVLGVRYGSGTMFHKVEGQTPVYWTGPSIGFDAGANAAQTFILVYNLYDTNDLFRRYPAGEGAAYLVGGFNASYLRRNDVVLIPVRLGVGARLGINAGYMKFRRKQNWMPF